MQTLHVAGWAGRRTAQAGSRAACILCRLWVLRQVWLAWLLVLYTARFLCAQTVAAGFGGFGFDVVSWLCDFVAGRVCWPAPLSLQGGTALSVSQSISLLQAVAATTAAAGAAPLLVALCLSCCLASCWPEVSL
jgi:hypothetical protein